jgi:hypothetical protein
MCSPHRSTVPVTCPSCRHEGPAYRYLLGKISRCKMCGHDFRMPGHVRIPCPGCRFGLRVPAELIDHDVSCKFCDQGFRVVPAMAWTRESSAPVPARPDPILDAPDEPAPPALVDRSGESCQALLMPRRRQSPTCPGEHAAIPIAPPTSGGLQDDPDFVPRFQAIRDEFHRLERAAQGQVEHLLSLERTVAGIVVEQGELLAELRRSRTDNEAMARQGLEGIERLRDQLGRLEAFRETVVREQDWSPLLPHQSHQSPQPSFARNSPRTNGHGRVLTTRPPQKPGGATRSSSGRAGNGGHLRETFDRLSNCERMADRLIAQVNATRQEKEYDRAAFERILERLQDELCRATNDFEAARVRSNSATRRGANSAEECGPLATASPSAAEFLP